MRPRPVRHKAFVLGGKGRSIVDILVTKFRARGFGMETFTLVAWFVLCEPRGGDFADMRVPGLMEAECKMRAKEFAAPRPRIGGAYFVIEGWPEPVWTRPPDNNPPGPCANCGAIPGRKPAWWEPSPL